MHITPPAEGPEGSSQGRFITAQPPAYAAPPAGAPLMALILLAIVSIGGLIGLYLYSRSLDGRLDQMQQTLQASIKENSDQLQALAGKVDLDTARHSQLQGQLTAAQSRLGSTASELQREQQALAQQQKQDSQQLNSQLGQLQQQQQATQGGLGSLSTDVTGVKTDVKSTQDQLAATRADLQRTIGDMGVQSGLIAKNHGDLEALRALGDRDIVEFDVTKAKKPQRVGTLQFDLRNTDPKRGKYTINLIADDHSVEKKDKNLLEPVQFYRVGDHQPTEIVVQQIFKNRIVGYVSSPKHGAPASVPASKG